MFIAIALTFYITSISVQAALGCSYEPKNKNNDLHIISSNCEGFEVTVLCCSISFLIIGTFGIVMRSILMYKLLRDKKQKMVGLYPKKKFNFVMTVLSCAFVLLTIAAMVSFRNVVRIRELYIFGSDYK